MADDSKKKLRARIRALLVAQDPRSRAAASFKIAEKLFSCEAFKKASQVGFYASLPEEVDTAAMIDRSLESGKRVAVPKCDIKKNGIKFYEIKARSELKKGVLGIPEPKGDPGRLVDPSALDCVIVPGLAFDRNLNRLGRGGGFYDRFLKEVPKAAKRIGLAFSFQVVAEVPTGTRDVKVDLVITEDGRWI